MIQKIFTLYAHVHMSIPMTIFCTSKFMIFKSFCLALWAARQGICLPWVDMYSKFGSSFFPNKADKDTNKQTNKQKNTDRRTAHWEDFSLLLSFKAILLVDMYFSACTHIKRDIYLYNKFRLFLSPGGYRGSPTRYRHRLMKGTDKRVMHPS